MFSGLSLTLLIQAPLGPICNIVGGVISPVLANLTLDGLEKHLAQQLPKITSEGNYRKLNTVRFADDFVVTASSKAFLQQEVQPMIEQFLHQRGLTLSPEKTTITHIDEGFDFLGQNICFCQTKRGPFFKRKWDHFSESSCTLIIEKGTVY